MKIKLLALLLLTATIGFSQKKGVKKGITTTPLKTMTTANPNEGLFAEMMTTKGKILLRLEYTKAPVTVANFVSLSEGNNPKVGENFKGKRFYDGLKFHRVIASFMIQGGDPQGTGSGGPGYAFKDEFDPSLVHDKGGILSMANSGPKTNGSQFFITHKDTPWLNNKHSIFGSVVSGMDVVNAIKQDDVITKVTIVRKGKAATNFDAVKIFESYFAGSANEEAIEKAKKELEAKKIKDEYMAKFGPAVTAKAASFVTNKAKSTKSASGLEYIITQKSANAKPVAGTKFGFNYAGFLEDGTLFDSNIADVNRTFGKFDEKRAANPQGYAPFPLEAGKLLKLIPGFTEAIEMMSIGDKGTFFIPANLGYGERGAGGLIPPNANLIFEVELVADPTPAPVVQTPQATDK